MDRFEVMHRLSKELGTYIHINFKDHDHVYSEDEYQELKEQLSRIFNNTKSKKENSNETE